MKKRIKLADRVLPNYYRGEEIMNMVTHIAGGGLGIIALVLCVLRSIFTENTLATIGSAIFGVSMIMLYTVSSVYHGLQPGTAKKVMQVIDHCSIYFLIVGTYTAILLAKFVSTHPVVGWSVLIAEWSLAAVATTLTAIDLKKHRVFSMVCYICMGWCIVLFFPMTRTLLTPAGANFLLAGGIVYTIGAVLFGVGSKIHWMHSVFHIFVVIGSFLHFIVIFFFAI